VATLVGRAAADPRRALVPWEELVPRFVAVAFAAAVASQTLSPATGAAEPPNFAGVWDGTIGDLPVRACFNEPDEREGFGTYYYKSHLQPISLRRMEDADRTYGEGYPWEKKIPRWSLDKVTTGEIVGRWSNGQHQLSIHLTRVAGLALKEDETPCGSTLFQEPRLQGIHIATKPAVKDGVRYSRLILEYPDHKGVGVETFALVGIAPALRHINLQLRKPFSGNPPDWHDCEVNAANSNSSGGQSETYEPTMFTRRWLSAKEYVETYCGGAHPDSWAISHTFDLRTGREVDLSNWFNKQVGQAGFRRLLFAGWTRGEDAECREVVEQSVRAFALDIEMTRTGMIFTPNGLPHAVAACGDEFFVPFAKLARYLTPEGQKQIAALRTETIAKR
jgi:hypothetical protein